jgi:serine protease Do
MLPPRRVGVFDIRQAAAPFRSAPCGMRHEPRSYLFSCCLSAALALLPAPSAGQMPDFTRLMREEGRVVVNVSTTYRLDWGVPDTPLGEPSAEELLRDFLRRQLEPYVPYDYEARSLGSGFIIAEDGYILTNAHVVGGPQGQEIVVRLADRREFEARVVGADRLTDIALLKIDARGLPAARIGDPQRLEPGEWVAAVGSPFGFERSITAGIVSAKGRTLPEESYVPFIQSDVAVNPGNSGGPLFNLRGEVVGVNSLIYSESGGYMGLSFAVPIDFAMEVAAQLREQGRVTRGRIGVHVQEVTGDLARALRLPRPSGALITEVQKDSPAARAGLRAGDVVTRFAGSDVEGHADLVRLTARTPPGTVAAIEVVRGGEPIELRVRVGEARAEAEDGAPPARAPLDVLGLHLAPLTAELRERHGIEGGVRVQRAEGAAQRAGLQRGDIILAVNGEPVAGVADFNRRIAAAGKGATVALLVQRPGGRLYLALRVPG